MVQLVLVRDQTSDLVCPTRPAGDQCPGPSRSELGRLGVIRPTSSTGRTCPPCARSKGTNRSGSVGIGRVRVAWTCDGAPAS